MSTTTSITGCSTGLSWSWTRRGLRDKYHDLGYLDFKIEDVKITPTPEDPEYIDIDFKVTEGEPYKVEKLSVGGNTVFTNAELERCFSCIRARPFRVRWRRRRSGQSPRCMSRSVTPT